MDSDFERQKIRAHHQKHPGLLQSEVARWASDFLRRKINQFSISEILSDKFKQLDLAKLPRRQGLRERKRSGEHPLLEEALFEWHQRLQNLRIPITGDLIRTAVSQLWQRIPVLSMTVEPKWSIRWLEGFKSRNGIRKRTQHGEAASVNMEGAEDHMVELRAIVAPYPPKDVYNMDETGLF